MKLFALSLFSFALSATLAVAAPAQRTFEVAGDVAEMKAEVEDGETVRLLMPFVEKAEPRAEIVEESLIYEGRCEVLSVKNEAPRVEMLFRMPSTVADSGFNGCRAVIDRGYVGDDSDQLSFAYGYEILD